MLPRLNISPRKTKQFFRKEFKFVLDCNRSFQRFSDLSRGNTSKKKQPACV